MLRVWTGTSSFKRNVLNRFREISDKHFWLLISHIELWSEKSYKATKQDSNQFSKPYRKKVWKTKPGQNDWQTDGRIISPLPPGFTGRRTYSAWWVFIFRWGWLISQTNCCLKVSKINTRVKLFYLFIINGYFMDS